MPGIELKRAGGFAYREVAPGGSDGRPPVLCVHGYPETSLMWRELLEAIRQSGRRGLAPDLPGYGATPYSRSGAWERHVEAIAEFHEALDLGPVTLVVHDWGGMIALRWACEHPESVAGLVVANTGFFPDGKWHGLAKVLRTEGEGEILLERLDREALAGMLHGMGRGFDEERIDDYFRAYDSPEGRQGQLELYRSGDFSKLEPYEGKLAELGVPVLILWGEQDQFAPVAGAYRFRKEVPDAELFLIPDAGHFVFEDEPARCAEAIIPFLDRSGL